MFIKNLKTNVIQECHNSDVIKICKKNPNEYMVSKTKKELLAVVETKEKVTVKELSDYDSMKVDELRELAKSKDIEGYSKMKKDELVAALEASEIPGEVM